ncbi:hypothetical protein BGZ98_009829 [Dissophora globulifera]|uniref:Uncharacterized protein n=1 Tax=Dissophora globulifera TaxID=979702 RepID=A0A9P6R2P6_9FUNG|nr:hypothetical protein BGZ98_009829 [Dissophora globulifera]KAG0311430.1 hypothetical protein BGZ99_010170 [Dissophora globulifera]
MSRKLATQALDSLLNSQPTSLSKTAHTTITKKSKKSKKTRGDQLPATKTGLKKIKHELRYGHSVKRVQEAEEAKVNPLDKLKSQMEREQAIVERNLNYFKITNRVSKKELELRNKIKVLRARALGDQSRKTEAELDESDGEE